MRIGIDGRLWNETGVGRYVRSLYHYLAQIDKENEYVWFLGRREYDSLVLPSPKWRKALAEVHWHTLAEQLVLPWIFYRERLDLLHFPYFSFPILYPGKFVITIHDLIFDHFKTGRWSTLPFWFYLIKKAGYHVVNFVSVRKAKAIITLSHDAKEELVSHYGADEKKVRVTYESGSLEDRTAEFTGGKFDRIRKLRPYLLYVGNAHPHKNVQTLVVAMHELRKNNQALKLVLVGSDRFFYPRLAKWALENGFSSSVVVVGEVLNTEIAGWYHFAKAFVTASKMEGFGIPPLEAMSVGCPAIVSDIPVFHEVYGDAAAYFDQDDPKAAAEAISQVLSDKGRIKKLIELGHLQATKYSWKKMTGQTVRVYESCFGL